MADQHLIYHWKHGWIPLTHAAALSKAKGNPRLADKYVKGTSAHHAARPTAGMSARQLHGGLEPHKPHVHTPAAEVAKLKPGDHATVRGIDENGHDIAFTGTVQSRPTLVRIKRPGSDEVHHHYAVRIANGDGPRITVYTHVGPETPEAEKPKTPAGGIDREYFGKTGPDLREAAKKGDTRAQAELDRRAAKRGKPSTPDDGITVRKVGNSWVAEHDNGTNVKSVRVAHNPSLTPAENRAAARKALTAGMERDVKRYGPRPGDPGSAPNPDWRPRGTPPDAMDRRPEAPPTAEEAMQMSDAELLRLQRSPFAEHRAVALTERIRRGRAAQEAAGTTDPRQAEWDSWNARIQRILPAGHTIKSKAMTPGGSGFHTHYNDKGERIGSVVERPDGKFGVRLNGVPMGTYDSRPEAHVALAQAATKESTAAREKAAKAAATRAKRKSPSVHWQPHEVPSDGTKRGDAAAAKVKQAYKMGNHTVEIESALNTEQTKGLLDDIHSVLLKSGHLDSEGIVFRVPTGDSTFRQKRTGVVGAYVRVGQRAIHVNPKVADASSDLIARGGFGVSEHFMPARARTTARQYVLTHELGHVVDHAHNHTRDNTTMERTPGGQQIPNFDPNLGAAALHRQHRGDLSRYGLTNKHEGYAEAFAQWVHGGPGSSKAADAYAAQYGWAVPLQFRHRGSA